MALYALDHISLSILKLIEEYQITYNCTKLEPPIPTLFYRENAIIQYQKNKEILEKVITFFLFCWTALNRSCLIQ